MKLVIEGSYNKTDAERDAEKRMEQLSVDAAIAIHYPHEFPQQLTEPEIEEKLKTARFGLKVIVAEDISGTLYEYFQKDSLLNLESGYIDLTTIRRYKGSWAVYHKREARKGS